MKSYVKFSTLPYEITIFKFDDFSYLHFLLSVLFCFFHLHIAQLLCQIQSLSLDWIHIFHKLQKYISESFLLLFPVSFHFCFLPYLSSHLKSITLGLMSFFINSILLTDLLKSVFFTTIFTCFLNISLTHFKLFSSHLILNFNKSSLLLLKCSAIILILNFCSKRSILFSKNLILFKRSSIFMQLEQIFMYD